MKLQPGRLSHVQMTINRVLSLCCNPIMLLNYISELFHSNDGDERTWKSSQGGY